MIRAALALGRCGGASSVPRVAAEFQSGLRTSPPLAAAVDGSITVQGSATSVDLPELASIGGSLTAADASSLTQTSANACNLACNGGFRARNASR